ncbi:hypothetical protein D3C84_1112810 [compost metagenome]
MTARLGANRREGLHLRAVLLHVFLAGAAEESQCRWHAVALGEYTVDDVITLAVGAWAVGPVIFQGARLHLLETERQGAIDRPAFHGLTG